MNINDSAHVTQFLDQHGAYAVAVSLGSVFFGAMTYSGNLLNFMVKAIVDHLIHAELLLYIRYSVPILALILALVGWVFLHK